jgi:2-dehydro-3-deoxy-D-gluconate 5-dehydrogenase
MTEKFINNLFSLSGLNVVITGASSGLGLEMAHAMAQCGANVFALSRTGKPKVDFHTELPKNITFMSMDVTNSADVAGVLSSIGNEHGIDVLVNNAGITRRKKAEELTDAEWLDIHDANVNGVFYCCRHAFPYLSKSAHVGRIINISSMASYMGFAEVVPYVSSKSSVAGLTRGLAVEWRKHNILVNSVSPGWFPSLMNQQVMDDDRKAKILSKIPLERFGKPEELSPMVIFLASNASTYITGQDFSVDGGARAFGF